MPLLALFALVLVLGAAPHDKPKMLAPLRLTCGADSTIQATTTPEDLERRFGKENVKDGDIYVGEGSSEPGTLLFPGDAEKEIGIIWRGSGGRKHPATVRTFVHFEQRASDHYEEVAQRTTAWKGPGGITIGTDLKAVERLNRRPFRLTGFGWDGSGTVLSWGGGRLASEGSGCYLMLRFTPPEQMIPETKPVTGSEIFSSGHPAMQKVNPTVYQMILSFEERAAPLRR